MQYSEPIYIFYIMIKHQCNTVQHSLLSIADLSVCSKVGHILDMAQTAADLA